MKHNWTNMLLVALTVVIASLNTSEQTISKEKKYILENNKCIEVEILTENEAKNKQLPNKEKYEKAKSDAQCIAPYEVLELQPLYKSETVKIVHLYSKNKCQKYKPQNGEYFGSLNELQEFYKNDKSQFSIVQDRLNQLIGSNDDNNCLAVIELEAKYLYRPTSIFSFDDTGKPSSTIDFQPNNKKEDGYPFTNLGYACDWYYGDGCRRGLSEFILQDIEKAIIEKKMKVLNACKVNDCAVSIMNSGA